SLVFGFSRFTLSPTSGGSMPHQRKGTRKIWSNQVGLLSEELRLCPDAEGVSRPLGSTIFVGPFPTCLYNCTSPAAYPFRSLCTNLPRSASYHRILLS